MIADWWNGWLAECSLVEGVVFRDFDASLASVREFSHAGRISL